MLKNIFLVLLCLLCLAACERDTSPVGPSLEELYAPFSVAEALSTDKESVDFSAGELLFFSAKLNKIAAWRITITGQISGAIKVLEGLDKNIEASWDGGITFAPFFNAEPCIAVLDFPQEVDAVPQEVSFTLLSGKDYSSIPYSQLITDFESGLGNIWGPTNHIFVFGDAGATNGWEPIFMGVSDSLGPVSGAKHFFLNALDRDESSFVAGFWIKPPILNPDLQYFPLTGEASQNYLNFFLYGTGNDDTKYQINIIGNSGNEAFQASFGGLIDWTGWRLISFNLGDAEETNIVPDSITELQFLMFSNSAQSDFPVSYGVDYVMFTKDAPL